MPDVSNQTKNRNSAPDSAGSNHICPPCSSTIFRQMVNPNPAVGPAESFLKGRNARSAMPASIPGPLSATDTNQPPGPPAPEETCTCGGALAPQREGVVRSPRDNQVTRTPT